MTFLSYVLCGVIAKFGVDLIASGWLPFTVAGWLVIAAAAAGFAWLVASHVAWRMHGIPALRRQLIAIVAERAPQDVTWVNDGENVAFRADVGGIGPLRRHRLLRTADDPVRDLRAAGPGATAVLSGEAFFTATGEPGFRQRVVGHQFMAAVDSIVPDPFPAPAQASLTALLGLRIAGRATAAAGLAEAIRQFQDAEPPAKWAG